MSIPNVARFVWTGQAFPYQVRLGVESVLLADPEARVVLHTLGSAPCAARHWERVLLYDRVEARPEDPRALFAELPAPVGRYVDLLAAIGPAWPLAQASLVRLAVLHRDGGYTPDSEVLLVRSPKPLLMAPAFVSEEPVTRAGRALRAAVLRAARHRGNALTFRVAGGVARAVSPRLAPLGARARSAPASGSGAPEITGAVFGAQAGNPWVRRALLLALELHPAVPAAFRSVLLSRAWQAEPGQVLRIPAAASLTIPSGGGPAGWNEEPRTVEPEALALQYVQAAGSGCGRGRLDEDRVLALRHTSAYYAAAADVQLRARELPLGPVPFRPTPRGPR